MKNQKFKTGEYKQQEGIFKGKSIKYKSFTPSLLNKPFNWTDEKINIMLEEAVRQLGELNAYSELIPDVDIFIQMHILKEATDSSRIEGTVTNLDEALLSEEDIKPDKRDDWEEVQNYIKAMNFAIEGLKKRPVSQNLIKMTHEILLTGVRGVNKQPGEFRNSQNWIGASSIEYATHIPPHFSELNELLSDLEQFWHNDDLNIPQLIKIAMFHYQFETIHPFSDGNGRIGRLLITLQLIEREYLSKPTLYLSDYFERNRETYLEMLSRVKKEDNIELWIKFFLQGVEETAIKGKQTFRNIIILQKDCAAKILSLGKKIQKAQEGLKLLYSKPIVSINDMALHLNSSYNTAADLVEEFVKLDILKEFSSKQRNKKYVFKAYLDLF